MCANNSHIKKCQKSYACDQCDQQFISEGNLSDHKQIDHKAMEVEELPCAQCQYCDLMIQAETDFQALKDVKMHYEICVCKPKTIEKELSFECDLCDFRTNDVAFFKRHRRDRHDLSTSSTSPKHKKRRKT